MPLPDDVVATFPEALRAEASLQDFKDVAGLASSYVETKRALGSRIPIPGPDAAPEKRTEFLKMLTEKVPEVMYIPKEGPGPDVWERLGRPKEAKDYVVSDEAVKAGLNADELRALGAKAGLTQAQFAEQVKLMVASAGEQRAAFTKAHEALKTEWGAAHADKVAAAAAAGEKLGLSEAAVKAIKEGAAPAEQVRLLAAAAQALGANPREGDRQSGARGEGKMTPADAQAAIHEIMSNRNHAYWNAGDPAHRAAVQRIVQLQKWSDPTAVEAFETAGFRG